VSNPTARPALAVGRSPLAKKTRVRLALRAAATRTRVWVYSGMFALTDSGLARIAIGATPPGPIRRPPTANVELF